MIKVKRTITPVEDLSVDEIAAFETETFYGLYCDSVNSYVVIAKNDSQFNICIMPTEIIDDLGDMDDWMYKEYDERIIGVHKSSRYKLELN